ncbi:MBL fold metallo-hydrolase [Microbacterium sp. LjRoot45]|uniref:MBL fold metallo-hydrolase n=1 Tax=Microbacterium sp. LjRoot45 TaxID=3342329 RepID=UPI003ECCDB96
MQLAPGLHRIGNDIVAAYAIVTDGGVTLVDAGLPGMWADLRAELASLGRSLSDIRGVILTHGDSDHVGFAERLRRDHGVAVYVHEADAGRARGEKPPATPWPKMRLFPTLGFLGYSLRKGGARTHHLTEVVEISGETVLDLPGAPRVVPLPGHSPGSIAVHAPTVGALFVGDALTTRHVTTGRVGPQPAPFTDDPAGALDALTRLEGVDAAWVLPGHGAPWSGGVADLVRRVRADAAAS